MRKLVLLAIVLCVTGCGSSSPRFGASIAREKKAKKAVVRPATDEAREEAAEDDVKVDTDRIVKKVKSSSRTSKPAPRTAASRTSKKKAPLASPHVQAADPDSTNGDTTATHAASADTSAAVDQQRMMETIAEWLETPYSYGSDGNEAGIDCSAFTREVFEQAADITLPRSSAEQAQVGRRVQRDELKFGDLVFFRTRGRAISHVGIYLGDDLFAHASSGSGVTISSLDSTYFNKRYAAARRVTK